MKMSLDMADLTLGDLEAFEEATGLDMLDTLKPVPVIDPATGRPVPDPDNPKRPQMTARVTTRALLGLVYLSARKADPSVTLTDVKAMKLTDVEFELKDTEDASPLDEEPSTESSNAEPTDTGNGQQ